MSEISEHDKVLMEQNGITYDAEREVFLKTETDGTEHRTTSLAAMLELLGIGTPDPKTEPPIEHNPGEETQTLSSGGPDGEIPQIPHPPVGLVDSEA